MIEKGVDEIMYNWKNNKIKNQYDLQVMTAKNSGANSFTAEELSVTNLKTKNFMDIRDAQVKRLVELAYIRGRLDGLQTADDQFEDIPFSKKASDAILKKNNTNVVPTPQLEEQLYFVACKVKNRQDKIAYTSHSIKAHSDAEAQSLASTECGMRNQTLLLSKTVKTYRADTMQFQFGIGTKDESTLLELGKKMLKQMQS